MNEFWFLIFFDINKNEDLVKPSLPRQVDLSFEFENLEYFLRISGMVSAKKFLLSSFCF